MVFWKTIQAKHFAGILPKVNEKGQKKMNDKKIARINELYHKSKAEGLTEKEFKEQQVLRREYVEAFKRNLRGQLNNISIQEKDGSITDLGEKYGHKTAN